MGRDVFRYGPTRLKKDDSTSVLGQKAAGAKAREAGPSAASRIKLLEDRVAEFLNTRFQDSELASSSYMELKGSILQLQTEVRRVYFDRQAGPSRAFDAVEINRRCTALSKKLLNGINGKRAEGFPGRGINLPSGDELDHTNKKLRKPGPPPKGREPEEGLTDDELREQIIAKLPELSGQPLARAWDLIVNLKPIPTEPPGGQLYEDRPDKSLSAPEFIAAVYKGFLHGEFTRAHLRGLDPKAAMALYNWERDHGQRADINLPTKKELNDRLLDTPANALTPHERLAQKRIQSDRANNERRKTKTPR